MVLINLGLAIVSMFLCYQLALAFIGVTRTTKQVLLPVIVFTFITYVSKVVFVTTPTVHTIVLVLTCGLLLWIINKIEPAISFIGSLLSFTMVTLGDLLISYPLLIKMGLKLPSIPEGLEWIFINLTEFSIIILSIVLIRSIRFSITKFLPASTARS